MNKTKLGFWFVVGLQVLLLLYLVLRYYVALNSGTPVFLKVIPVDPRDFLRGDYVTLRYEISTIDLDKVQNRVKTLDYDTTVYVRLEKGAHTVWNATAIDTELKPLNSSEVWIKGQATSSPQNNKVSIKYGIERFFVPEGTGRIIEQERNREKVSAEIRVTKNGLCLIKQIYINDQPVDFKQIK